MCTSETITIDCPSNIHWGSGNPDNCPLCGGTEKRTATPVPRKYHKCNACYPEQNGIFEGKGTRGSGLCYYCAGNGYHDLYYEEPCDHCNTSGLCRDCGGTGIIKNKTVLQKTSSWFRLVHWVLKTKLLRAIMTEERYWRWVVHKTSKL